jgi:hypothetical protein
MGLKLNGTHQLLAYAAYVNLLGDNIDTTKGGKRTLIYANKEIRLEINVEKSNCSCIVTRMQFKIVT